MSDRQWTAVWMLVVCVVIFWGPVSTPIARLARRLWLSTPWGKRHAEHVRIRREWKF